MFLCCIILKQYANNLFKGFIPVIYNNKMTHLEGILEKSKNSFFYLKDGKFNNFKLRLFDGKNSKWF